jgi:hypothetical protein
MELKPSHAVALPQELGIEGVAALHARLAPVLTRPEPVVLEAMEVARLHTAALQLLAAFVRTRTDRGFVTEWHHPSSALQEGATRLGLESLLGLPASGT